MTNDERMRTAIERRNFQEIIKIFDEQLETKQPQQFVNEQHRRNYEKLKNDARLAAITVAGMFCSIPSYHPDRFEA